MAASKSRMVTAAALRRAAERKLENSRMVVLRYYLAFLKGDGACETSYADKAGKYMKQTGVTLPKI